MTVNVDAVNDAPESADNTVTTDEDTDYTFSTDDFTFSDVDSADSLDHITIEELPTNGTLYLSGVEVSAGDEITAANIANLVFRPAANENGDDYDSFTFTINDGTADSSSTYTMTVNVDAVNDAPESADRTVTTDEDTDYTFSTDDFTFSDVDSADTLNHITIVDLPTNGTLYLSGVEVSAGDEIPAADITNLVFRPAANENGDDYDSFTFTINDGTADSSSTYTMTVNVDAVNDAPVAVADTDSTNLGTNISVVDGSAKDVLIDDTDTEGSTLEVSAILAGRRGNSTSVASLSLIHI